MILLLMKTNEENDISCQKPNDINDSSNQWRMYWENIKQ